MTMSLLLSLISLLLTYLSVVERSLLKNAVAHVSRVPPFERHFARLIQLAKRRGDERLATRVRKRYEACVEATTSTESAAS